jgi:uroporphyrinogen decarboxylase
MGLGLAFVEGDGPRFERPLTDESSIARLTIPDPARLRYVFDAVASIKRALNGRVPLLGFAGSPFTLACYMIEGRGNADFARVRRLFYTRPDLLHRVLSVNADSVGTYLVEQIREGADAVMVFDTWGGLLSTRGYVDCSLAYIARVVERVRAHDASVPVIVFTKGGGQWLERIADCGCDAVGLDWTSRAILSAAGPDPGFVFNLGHGIVPETPPDNVGALVEFVHKASARTRASPAEGKSVETRVNPRSAGA